MAIASQAARSLGAAAGYQRRRTGAGVACCSLLAATLLCSLPASRARAATERAARHSALRSPASTPYGRRSAALHRRAGRLARYEHWGARRRPVVRRQRRSAVKVNRRSAVSASAPALVFGIYPGGAAGAVGASGPLHPEDPGKRLSALQLLRPPGRPFVLRLYVSYTGAGGYSAAAQAGTEIAEYAAAGFQVELVLCYRPADDDATADVPGFVSFVRETVAELGGNPSVVSLQVTNEANVSGAPNASDGYYAGAADALIRGVEGAKAESETDGFSQLKVGFNWAYQLGSSEEAFFSYLGERGGASFARALDWVGIDAYPGTWGPALPAGLSLQSATRQATVEALNALRERFMPLAGLSGAVPIHVCESGAPTGMTRNEAGQRTVLSSAVRAVYGNRRVYNVTDYRWFDLRDANTSSASFEDHYGLMSDAYVAKPAFDVYRTLMARL
jgi:hypothetical protein